MSGSTALPPPCPPPPLPPTVTAEVFARVDAERDQLLDDDENVLLGKGEDVKEAEKRLKHKLRPLNTWRLISYFELFMSCPKDGLHQWYSYLILLSINPLSRYRGLVGDHIVPTILYRYTQVLRRPDLLSSKGRPLNTKARGCTPRGCVEALGRPPLHCCG